MKCSPRGAQIEEDDVSIIDDEKLQDGPNNAWAADDILRHVKNGDKT
jgi:hypothetical protein